MTMNPDLTHDEILILQTMWDLKALGTRSITAQDLASRLTSIPKNETPERLDRLQARGMVTITKHDGDHLCALSALGAAFVRQLQDRQLGDLTGVS
jgi:hypothetical protein